jgi:hypothetical protein
VNYPYYVGPRARRLGGIYAPYRYRHGYRRLP